MAKTQPLSLDQVTEAIKIHVAQMKVVPGFRIGTDIREAVNRFADLIGEGKKVDATLEGNFIVGMLRGKLGAFLKFSVVDKLARDENPAQPSRFTQELAKLEREKFDEDLINRLRSKVGDMVEILRIETGEIFEKRIAAYRVLCTTLDEVIDEQITRDRKREIQEKAAKAAKNGSPVKVKEFTGNVAERQKMLKQQKEEADSIRGLVAF